MVKIPQNIIERIEQGECIELSGDEESLYRVTYEDFMKVIEAGAQIAFLNNNGGYRTYNHMARWCDLIFSCHTQYPIAGRSL